GSCATSRRSCPTTGAGSTPTPGPAGCSRSLVGNSGYEPPSDETVAKFFPSLSGPSDGKVAKSCSSLRASFDALAKSFVKLIRTFAEVLKGDLKFGNDFDRSHSRQAWPNQSGCGRHHGRNPHHVAEFERSRRQTLQRQCLEKNCRDGRGKRPARFSQSCC